jgi:hypothetical protein
MGFIISSFVINATSQQRHNDSGAQPRAARESRCDQPQIDARRSSVCSAVLGRSFAAFLTHCSFVPKIYKVAVGIAELGAISPKEFLWRLFEVHSASRKLTVLDFDIIDLECKSAARSKLRLRTSDQEQGQIAVILQRYGLALWDLELDFQTQITRVPLPGY